LESSIGVADTLGSAAFVVTLVRAQDLNVPVAYDHRLTSGLENAGDRLNHISLVTVVGEVRVLLERLANLSMKGERIRGTLRVELGDDVDLSSSCHFRTLSDAYFSDSRSAMR
jgi:hypothetical protein